MANPLNPGLFDAAGVEQPAETTSDGPLADRMRPRTLTEFVGQAHLLGEGKPLRRLIEAGTVHSMVFWGPPGTGKTTLARLIARHAKAQFLTISAVLAGVKDIRAAVEKAKLHKQASGGDTILFVDEVHRFNKAQQDAFLPHVESGDIVLMGATTENPALELVSPLLSRCKVVRLEPLDEADLVTIQRQALETSAPRGLGGAGVTPDDSILETIATFADGDARVALSTLEIAADIATQRDGDIDDEAVAEAMQRRIVRFGQRTLGSQLRGQPV